MTMDCLEKEEQNTSAKHMPIRREKIRKENLEFGHDLGYGSFSKVVLATHKTTGVKYAVKIVSKLHMISEQKVHYVMNEKNILRSLHHPNIIRLLSTFQTNDELFYILEYAEGGELLEYIKKVGRFDYDTARHVSAELVNGLEYIHSKNIAHRDIKPENILLDGGNHVKIIDFGTAVFCTDQPTQTLEKGTDDESMFGTRRMSRGECSRSSFCGTAQYASPELLNNCTTTRSSDLWALGCVIYQLLTGKRPFQSGSDYLTFKRVLELDVRYNSDFPPIARDLCEKLLVLNPSDRLGAGPNGYKLLKAHSFFKDIDFEALPTQTLSYNWKTQAPNWVADNNAEYCYECQSTFTFFVRKHHCRACGNIFCNQCSNSRTIIPYMEYQQPVRVCNHCFIIIKNLTR